MNAARRRGGPIERAFYTVPKGTHRKTESENLPTYHTNLRDSRLDRVISTPRFLPRQMSHFFNGERRRGEHHYHRSGDQIAGEQQGSWWVCIYGSNIIWTPGGGNNLCIQTVCYPNNTFKIKMSSKKRVGMERSLLSFAAI